MKLLLNRDFFNQTTTLGKLYINGAYECETLEDFDAKLENGGKKEYGKNCIPRGTYKISIDYSKRFNKDMPHLLDVPQFDGIRIHCGNTIHDTDGCVLVGKLRINNNSIGYSKDAFRLLFQKLDDAYERNEEIIITII